MATAQIRPSNRVKITDPTRDATNGAFTDDLGTPGNYTDNTALDARLVVLGYTQIQLNKMSLNDKHYALKLQDDPTIGEK